MTGDSALRSGLNQEAALDTLYAIDSPETYNLLTADRGRSPARFGAWYADGLARLLFEEPPV
ncbi:MAG: hypothetical protein M3406_17220 [Chloroflexota bacterium]|nr:hypothetical protein [Chloroflexota bacterium]